jgi:hypothetical protein
MILGISWVVGMKYYYVRERKDGCLQLIFFSFWCKSHFSVFLYGSLYYIAINETDVWIFFGVLVKAFLLY